MSGKPKLMLTVRKTPDQEKNQFWIDSNHETAQGEWDDIYVGISGHFGHLGPHVFAAAPDLYELACLVHSSFGGGRVITFSDDDIARFDAALAKARGEA